MLPGIREWVIECSGVPSLGQVWDFALSVQGFDDDLGVNNDAHEAAKKRRGRQKGHLATIRGRIQIAAIVRMVHLTRRTVYKALERQPVG